MIICCYAVLQCGLNIKNRLSNSPVNYVMVRQNTSKEVVFTKNTRKALPISKPLTKIIIEFSTDISLTNIVLCKYYIYAVVGFSSVTVLNKNTGPPKNKPNSGIKQKISVYLTNVAPL